MAGTYRYMPPEQHNEKVTLKSDIWAFGCVLFELSTGMKPFDGMNEYAMCYQIFIRENPLSYAIENAPRRKLQLLYDNPDLMKLIRSCFSHDHSCRPSSFELVNHEFFNKYTNIVATDLVSQTNSQYITGTNYGNSRNYLYNYD